MRRTKQDWFGEGLAVLTEQGPAMLTIDLLTSRLSVTKGSFYHHFQNIQDYKTQLLGYIESEGTLQVIQITEQARTPWGKLQKLLGITAAAPGHLEIAVRAWALQDSIAYAFQERIDARRIAYVKELCAALLNDEAQALTMAQLLYATYVGSQQIVPPIEAADRARLYMEIARIYSLSIEQGA